jgi:hypothetical protein
MMYRLKLVFSVITLFSSISFQLMAQKQDTLYTYLDELGEPLYIFDSIRLKQHFKTNGYPYINPNQAWEILDTNLLPQDIRQVLHLIPSHLVEDEFTGIEGRRSRIHGYFKSLEKIATAIDFIKLSAHPNPAIRCYSFWALVKIKHNSIPDLINLHSEDLQEIKFYSGCTYHYTTVKDFIQTILKYY